MNKLRMCKSGKDTYLISWFDNGRGQIGNYLLFLATTLFLKMHIIKKS